MTDFGGDESPPASSRSRSASDRPPSASAPTDRKLRRSVPPPRSGSPDAQTVSTISSSGRSARTPGAGFRDPRRPPSLSLLRLALLPVVQPLVGIPIELFALLERVGVHERPRPASL